MKALVFLLVVANLLFYAFAAGLFGHPDNPDAGRPAQQVKPDALRIVARGDAPAKAETPPPAAPESAPEAAPPVVDKTPVCLLWEKLAVADADRLAALIGDKFGEFRLGRQAVAGESSGWWVYIPPLPGKPDADRKAAELRGLGITDYFQIQEGPNRFAISLGIYSSEKGAQERLAEVKAKGVRSARLTPRPGKEGTLTLRASGPAGQAAALQKAVGDALPKNEARPCP